MIRLPLSLKLFPLVIVAAFLSGCGSSSSNAPSGAAWSISLAQTGSFAPNGVGQYVITVSNSGSIPSRGTVSVGDILPGLLTPTSIFGPGWNCIGGEQVACTRADSLPAGDSYPTITLVTNVSPAASGTITNNATVSGGGAGSQTGSLQTVIGSTPASTIQHVVILFQEGRTPDNLFQDETLIGRGADIQNYGYTSNGAKVSLAPTSLATGYVLANNHSSFLGSCAWVGFACAMDGADHVTCSGSGCPATNAAYQYVQDASVQPYYAMAETYAFADRMFQTNQGPTFPAHQYIISGTSAVCVPGALCPILANLAPSTSSYFGADNPSSNSRDDGTFWGGCLAPPGSILNLIDTSQAFPNSNYWQILGPECFEHPTLTDALDSKAVSWRYYAATAGSPATAPNAIAHMCQPTGDPNSSSCGGPDWTASDPKVVIEGSGAQVVTDIQNGKLAAVTWVIPADQNSDQPGDQGDGPSWVASVVNTIGESQFWPNTAIIVTWDNWGGWYDHVPPPVRSSSPFANSNTYGLRVPLIFISPYAKPQHVSHQYNDFGSVLRFIEQVFSLPQVNPTVGYADSYALGDLSDFYDLSQVPLTFSPIASEKGTKYFLDRK